MQVQGQIRGLVSVDPRLAVVEAEKKLTEALMKVDELKAQLIQRQVQHEQVRRLCRLPNSM
jgi:hypothetical protein